ncbi:MAG TPA: transporter [Candidatus Acidoferrum sp.]|nr:transporter [Candidatus Acidoferrum sp.]
MPILGKLAIAAALEFCAVGVVAQDLAPRAYVITPLNSNAITLTYSYYTGGLQFDGAVPITGATAQINVPVFTYYYSLNFFGRSANILAAFPYALGNLQGKVIGAESHLYRSGLLDSAYRFSVNLKGGPALPLDEFVKWRQKMLIGVSLKVVAPTGQYDPAKLINLGNNRWAFKPEIGYSQRWGHWVVDAYGAAWFYTRIRSSSHTISTFPVHERNPRIRRRRLRGTSATILSRACGSRWMGISGTEARPA